MARRKTWDVLEWPAAEGIESDGELMLACPHCGSDAAMPTLGPAGSPIIAAIGLGLIFDDAGHRPPERFLPGSVRCRTCRKVWESRDG